MVLGALTALWSASADSGDTQRSQFSLQAKGGLIRGQGSEWAVLLTVTIGLLFGVALAVLLCGDPAASNLRKLLDIPLLTISVSRILCMAAHIFRARFGVLHRPRCRTCKIEVDRSGIGGRDLVAESLKRLFEITPGPAHVIAALANLSLGLFRPVLDPKAFKGAPPRFCTKGIAVHEGFVYIREQDADIVSPPTL